MESSLADIQKKTEEYAAVIDAPKHLMPSYGKGFDEFQPNIAQDANGQLRYEIYERGQLITNLIAAAEDELLYFIFRDITFSMAIQYEYNNRNSRQDSRRVLFAYQLDLLGKLNEKWKERKLQEQQAILVDNPFDDNSTLRLDHFDKLMKAGKTYEQAMSEANKKFATKKRPPSGFPQ